MVTSAAVAVCVLMAALATFQVALASGAPWGRFAWGGQHDVLPGRLRVGSAVSVVIYALITAVVVARAGLLGDDTPGSTVRVAAWAVTAYFALGIAVNAASRSRPERLVMTPLCAALAALCAVVSAS